jgi:hypothetical protein
MRKNKALLVLLAPMAVILIVTFAAGNVFAVDDKACSQQERANATLSEKLDQTAGVICPPDVDPAIKAPTPDAGKMPIIPPPGNPGGGRGIQPK